MSFVNSICMWVCCVTICDPDSVDCIDACFAIACCFLVENSTFILEGVGVTSNR